MKAQRTATSSLASLPSAAVPAAVPAASALRIECISKFSELEPHAAAWNRLAYEAPDRLPMPSYAFVRPYLEYQLEPGESWCCYLVYEGERLVGVLPLVRTIQRLLGDGCPHFRSPSNPHITSVSLLTAAGLETRVADFILAELSRREPHYLELSFERLHPQTPLLSVIQAHRQGLSAVQEVAGRGSYLEIQRSFLTYIASLGQNFRRNLRRWDKKLDTLSDVRTLFLSGRDAHSQALEDFLRLEASGWKGSLGSAILSSPRRAEFYRAMVTEMRQAGWLELHFLQVGDRMIAGQLAMRMQRTLVVWKIAYDEEFAFCAPGNLLFEKTIERAYLSGEIDEVNCLTDMNWHRNWKMAQRPYYNLSLYPRRPLPFLLGIVPARVRTGVKSVPGLRSCVTAVRGLLS